MTYAKHHLFIRNKSQKNPSPNTPQTWADGKGAFLAAALPATGWMAKHGCPFADQISRPIPSLASPEAQSYTDGPLKWVLDYGALSDDELWAIVVFLRRLPPLGSQKTPDMYTHFEVWVTGTSAMRGVAAATTE